MDLFFSVAIIVIVCTFTLFLLNCLIILLIKSLFTLLSIIIITVSFMIKGLMCEYNLLLNIKLSRYILYVFFVFTGMVKDKRLQ